MDVTGPGMLGLRYCNKRKCTSSTCSYWGFDDVCELIVRLQWVWDKT